MKIRKFQKMDTNQVADLIVKTHKKFDVFGGVKSYIDHYSTKKNKQENLLKKFKMTPIFYVVESGNKIIGVIRGDKNNRIVNLFVDEKYHRQKLGTKLYKKFEKDVLKKGAKFIKVKSSEYGIPFYKKMGFKKTTGARNFKDLVVYPMKKILNK